MNYACNLLHARTQENKKRNNWRTIQEYYQSFKIGRVKTLDFSLKD